MLMTAVLATAPVDQPTKAADAPAPNVDGKWLIVYAEEGGRRVQGWEQHVATLKDGVLTYDREGKDVTIDLKFGPKQTLKAASGATAGSKEAASDGVYIAGQDYLCISLTGGSFTGGDKPKEESKEKDAKADEPAKGPSSGNFILILRRQR
jgi:hypothetical protein